jgi:translation initiation factor 1
MSGLVYSTETGRMCPDCGKPFAKCACKRQGGGGRPSAAAQSRPNVPSDGVVRVGRETKGRKGAGVTVVTGAPLDASGLAELCTQLKKRCGSGGAVKDGVVEIQGDHRDAIVAELSQRGWTVKRIGG